MDHYVQSLLQALIFTDTGETVIMPSTGLEWKKCSQGQAFLATLQNCQANFNPLTQDGLYGAQTLVFCTADDHSCNVQSLPLLLTAPTNGAGSPLYNSCNLDTTGGHTDWRVPSPIELKGIVNTQPSAMLATFPDTIDGYYWSSYGDFNDLILGHGASVISFRIIDYGVELVFPKTNAFFARCVRNF